MRQTISRRFDVLVVVWVLTLAVGFSLVAITHSQPADGQWTTNTTQVHDGPFWDYPVNDLSN